MTSNLPAPKIRHEPLRTPPPRPQPDPSGPNRRGVKLANLRTSCCGMRIYTLRGEPPGPTGWCAGCLKPVRVVQFPLC